MSDTEQIDLSDGEAPVVVARDEEDVTIRVPSSDDSIRAKKKKKKKKKKPRATSSERRSRSSGTESGSERAPRSKRNGSKKTGSKKKETPQVPTLSPNTSLSSGNNSSEGSKRKKKKVSQIDMTGGVTKIEPQMKKKPKGQSQLPRPKNCSQSGTEKDESSVKQKNAKESNGKKKKSSSRAVSPTRPKTVPARVHEIEEIEMPSKKRKKKRMPDNKTIEYGRVFGYKQNELAEQKQKRRGKRPSERTEKTFDYDEEDRRMRFSSSTMGSFGECSFGDCDSISRSNERHAPPVRRGRRREYDGEYTDDGDNDEDEDEDEYTDDEDDLYMREMGYNEPTDGSLYDDYFYDMHGLDDERPSFKRATFDLADTGIRDTKCCLIFAGIFFICSTVGVSILIGKLTRSGEW